MDGYIKGKVNPLKGADMATSYELFIMPGCPFCHKVIDFMERKGVSIPVYDTTRDGDARRRLLEIGGKTQVPCLFIDGEPLYESNDIIDYIQQNML